MVITQPIKPLSDVVNDVVSKFCPTADPEKIRTAIRQEVYDKIFPIIDAIDTFLRSENKLKRNLYAFRNDVYSSLMSDAYNEWGMVENVFEDVVMIEIQDARGEDCYTFQCFYEANITALHETIWPVFVSPLRERLWNLPKVVGRDSRITLKDQLKTFEAIRNELSKLLLEIDK